jgi:putative MATE family efflux protein
MEMVPSLGGVFNAAGNPKVPLRVNLIVASSTLVLESFLVLGVGFFPSLGITGASLSLVIANTFGTLYAFYVLLTGRATARINVHDLRLDRSMIRRIVRIALPALIHRGTPNLAQTIRLRLISIYGAVPLAVYSIVMRVVRLALMPCTALARATGVMVGQNLGAGKPHRSERAAYLAVGAIAVIATLVILSVSLFPHAIIGVFNKEPEVIEAGTGLIRLLGIGQIFFTLNLAMEMGLVGAADTVSPMVISIITLWCVQLPLIYLLSRMMGLGTTGIWIALVISPLIQCA